MSGEHPELVRLCAGEVSSEIRDAFRKLLQFIMGNQFVSIDLSDRIWKVIVGSGMGIGCSGDVSDLAFAIMAEVGYAVDLDVQAKYEIDLYVRFRDDIFIIIGGTKESRREFLDEFRRRTSFFRILVERISADVVQMLDLNISFSERWQRCCLLDVGMHFKNTAQGVALDDSSDHPMNIHSWPLARIRHFEDLCSSKRLYKDAALLFLRKLVAFAPTHSCIDTLVERISRSNPRQSKKRHIGSWLVLPYHRGLVMAGMSRQMGLLGNHWLQSEFDMYRPSVSWKLKGKSLLQFMQSDLQTKIKL